MGTADQTNYAEAADRLLVEILKQAHPGYWTALVIALFAAVLL